MENCKILILIIIIIFTLLLLRRNTDSFGNFTADSVYANSPIGWGILLLNILIKTYPCLIWNQMNITHLEHLNLFLNHMIHVLI